MFPFDVIAHIGTFLERSDAITVAQSCQVLWIKIDACYVDKTPTPICHVLNKRVFGVFPNLTKVKASYLHHLSNRKFHAIRTLKIVYFDSGKTIKMPPFIKKIIFTPAFNQSLHDVIFSDSIEALFFEGIWPSIPIELPLLPDKLKHLSIRRQVEKLVIPDSVEILELGGYFYIPPSQLVLPPHLKVLELGRRYRGDPLSDLRLPSGLEEFSLDGEKHFVDNLSLPKFPESIRWIRISPARECFTNPQFFDAMPRSLHKLTLDRCEPQSEFAEDPGPIFLPHDLHTLEFFNYEIGVSYRFLAPNLKHLILNNSWVPHFHHHSKHMKKLAKLTGIEHLSFIDGPKTRKRQAERIQSLLKSAGCPASLKRITFNSKDHHDGPFGCS